MVRTRSSANKAVAAKAPRKLTASTKGGRVAKRGRSSRALPPITPQPTPAWQKTIDKFLPKNENNEEPDVSTAGNSGVKSFMDPGGSSDCQDTGASEMVTGSDGDTADKEVAGSNSSGLQTGSDSEQPKAIAEIESNGVEDKNVGTETVGSDNDKDEKEVMSEGVETESDKVLNK